MKSKRKTIVISCISIIIIIIFVCCIILGINSKNHINSLNNQDNSLEEQDNSIETIMNSSDEDNSITGEIKSVSIIGGLNGIVGKTQAEATQILENANLKVTINEQTEFSNSIPAGSVIKCSGKRATGKWHYNYETMTDLEISNLKSAWKDMPNKVQEFLFEKQYEYVELTDTNLIEGDTLNLTISKGKEVKMPSLVNMSEEQAKQIIISNNLVYKETLVESKKWNEENTITKQSIPAGTSISEGTEITITINKFQEISVDVSSMCSSDDNANVQVSVSINGKEYTSNSSYIRTSETNVSFKVEIGNQGTLEVYIDGNKRYSTTINPNGKQKIIYIKNPNKVQSTTTTQKENSNGYVLDIY